MFFDNSRPDRRKRADKRDGVDRHIRLTTSLIPAPKHYELLTVDELFSGVPRTFIFDTECYHNYWLAAFKCTATGKVIFFENSPEGQLNANLLGFVMHRFLIVGFNSINYDMPMIALALHGLMPWKLKQISDEIIKEGKRPYEVEREYGVRIPDCNHIDLIEVAPIEASLKIYAGRLGCERMQDLPFKEDAVLERHQAMIVRDYCINDLDNTELLYNHLEPHIRLREILGKEYDQDMRSKSDAQVAEAIIGTELERTGAKIQKPTVEPGHTFYYDVPDYVSFKTPQFQHALDVVRSTPFVVGNGGSAECPEAISNLKPRLGSGIYRLGVGGLHSSEENSAYFADEDTLIIDRDVASYYPRIILNNRLFPPHIGEAFLEIYDSIVKRRLKLKKLKDPLEAGLKIAINGIFGKLGNLYSKVYAPHLLLQVCMTGQLCLMMLIEAIELAGISVISANTDGIVIKCPKARYNDLMTVIMVWENLTGFDTEETRYEGIFNRDVNNYIAVKTEYHVDEKTKEIVWHDGIKDGLKTKGVYSEKGSAQNSVLSKNPESYICSMAVQDFLEKGVPIADTVTGCMDIKRFVSVRTVKGGAYKESKVNLIDDWVSMPGLGWVRQAWLDEPSFDYYKGARTCVERPKPVEVASDGQFLGKAIRWYYAANERGTINYVISGNKVPKSEGAKPLMTLPVHFPTDIDYDHYINNANEILFDIGYYKRTINPTLF